MTTTIEKIQATTVQKIIRAAIPDASDELCEFILWDRTSYPLGEMSVRDVYRAARRYHRAYLHSRRLCELCDRLALDNELTCARCTAALQRAREWRDS